MTTTPPEAAKLVQERYITFGTVVGFGIHNTQVWRAESDAAARDIAAEMNRLISLAKSQAVLRAYAECEDARCNSRISDTECDDIFKRHGWDKTQATDDFLRDLRTKALAAAGGRNG